MAATAGSARTPVLRKTFRAKGHADETRFSSANAVRSEFTSFTMIGEWRRMLTISLPVTWPREFRNDWPQRMALRR